MNRKRKCHGEDSPRGILHRDNGDNDSGHGFRKTRQIHEAQTGEEEK